MVQETHTVSALTLKASEHVSMANAGTSKCYRIIFLILFTRIEAQLWRASLLWRASNGARVTALWLRWFGDSASANVHEYICSNGGTSSKGT